MNICNIKDIIISLLVCICIFSYPAAVSAGEISLAQQDKILSDQIDKSPSPLLYEQLAAVRAAIAAQSYAKFRSTSDPAALKQAIFNAASACELSPAWERPKALLGMIYSQFSSDRESLELAVSLLVQAAELNPADGSVRLLLAQDLMKLGRFWSAAEVYKGLFAESESMVTGVNTAPLALCFVLDGRVRAGVAYFSELQKKYPENRSVSESYAVLLRHDGQKKHATDIITGLAKNPKTDMAAQYYSELLKQWEREDAQN